jgi:hypothetical protein
VPPEGISDDVMQLIAAEMNLSETAFITSTTPSAAGRDPFREVGVPEKHRALARPAAPL